MKKLNEDKLIRFCSERGYKLNYFGERAIISTPLDQWKLEEILKGNGRETVIKLEHRNESGNKGRKEHFHTQRIVGVLEYALETIEEHGQATGAYNKMFEMKDLLDKQQ